MSPLRILGIVIFVAGLVMLGFSHYINGQVRDGRAQIESGQRTVDQANSVFSLNPYSKQVGQTLITNPAQKKIDEGTREADHYQKMADRLQVGGFICLGLGVIIFILGKKKRHSK